MANGGDEQEEVQRIFSKENVSVTDDDSILIEISEDDLSKLEQMSDKLMSNLKEIAERMGKLKNDILALVDVVEEDED